MPQSSSGLCDSVKHESRSAVDQILHDFGPPVSDIISRSLVTASFNSEDRFEWTPENGFRVKMPDRFAFIPFEREKIADLRDRLFQNPHVVEENCHDERPKKILYERSVAWWLAQLIHYGLPITSDKEQAQKSIRIALRYGRLAVPPRLKDLESRLERQYAGTVHGGLGAASSCQPAEPGHPQTSQEYTELSNKATAQHSRPKTNAAKPIRAKPLDNKNDESVTSRRFQEIDVLNDDEAIESIAFQSPRPFLKRLQDSNEDDHGSVIFTGVKPKNKTRSRPQRKGKDKEKTKSPNPKVHPDYQRETLQRNTAQLNANQDRAGLHLVKGHHSLIPSEDCLDVVEISSGQGDSVCEAEQNGFRGKKRSKMNCRLSSSRIDDSTDADQDPKPYDRTGRRSMKVSTTSHDAETINNRRNMYSLRQSNSERPVNGNRSLSPAQSESTLSDDGSPTYNNRDLIRSPLPGGSFSSQDVSKSTPAPQTPVNKAAEEIERSYDPESVPVLSDALRSIPSYLKNAVRHASPELFSSPHTPTKSKKIVSFASEHTQKHAARSKRLVPQSRKRIRSEIDRTDSSVDERSLEENHVSSSQPDSFFATTGIPGNDSFTSSLWQKSTSKTSRKSNRNPSRHLKNVTSSHLSDEDLNADDNLICTFDRHTIFKRARSLGPTRRSKGS